MWRSIAAAILLAVVSACAGTANAPEGEPTTEPAAIPVSRPKDYTVCQDALDVPEASIVLGIQHQDTANIAVSWRAEDCGFSSHPIDTLFLPRRSLLVPAGAGPELMFNQTPDAVSGFVWQPDFATIDDSDAFSRLEVPLDELRNTTRVDIEMEDTPSQTLNLGDLPLGEYAMEIQATWPSGSTGYAFHVEIVEP